MKFKIVLSVLVPAKDSKGNIYDGLYVREDQEKIVETNNPPFVGKNYSNGDVVLSVTSM
jgi:hypothetical protein